MSVAANFPSGNDVIVPDKYNTGIVGLDWIT
jgi:hypothetical protein